MPFDHPTRSHSGRFLPAAHQLTSVASLCAALLLSGCGKPGEGGPPGGGRPGGGMPPPEVSVITVQPKNIMVASEFVGQTAGSRETEVRARVSGILQERMFEEGTRVRAGTPLFQLDAAPFHSQMASAEAVVAVNEAKLKQTQRELARLEPLVREQAISQKEFDDASSAFDTAKATLQQARAQANDARLNLGYTRVVAPISGITSVAAKSNGSLVTAADSLLTTIVQTDVMFVNFSIPESDYLKLARDLASGQVVMQADKSDKPGDAARSDKGLGQSVSIRLADGSVFATSGKLTYVSERVNPATGGLDARAEVPNKAGKLHPGQFVRVSLQGASRANAITVPQRAVIDSPMGKIVFAVTPDNKLAPHPVELDGWVNGEWVVTKGVAAGERILVEGFIKAHDPGMTVKPVPYAPNANPNPTASGRPAAPPVSANSEAKQAAEHIEPAPNATKNVAPGESAVKSGNAMPAASAAK